MGCSQTSLWHQVFHLPSSCLGGVCCQWDQSGAFAGLCIVWMFLTCTSPCLPPSSVGSKEPPPPCSTSPGPKNACGDCDIDVHEHGFVFEEQSLQGGCRAARQGQAWPSQQGWSFCSLGPCSAFQACPAVLAASLLQKVVQGAEIVVNGGPTLAWPPVPGIFWVEGGHVPQASACVCCDSKGISHFSQFTWLIHSVLFLAPLSLPGSTVDS